MAEDWRARKRQTAHRKPPLLEAMDGRCRWGCGEPILRRLKKDGTPHAAPIASMHRGCAAEYRMCFSPSSFYDALVKRDGEACIHCGRSIAEILVRKHPRAGGECYVSWGMDGEFCALIPRKLAVVDHVIPLWSVRALSFEKLKPYFLIGNLQILCDGPDSCNRRKTDREAAERAHYDRLEAKRLGSRRLVGRDGQRLV